MHVLTGIVLTGCRRMQESRPPSGTKQDPVQQEGSWIASVTAVTMNSFSRYGVRRTGGAK